jgi:hypothetical protein
MKLKSFPIITYPALFSMLNPSSYGQELVLHPVLRKYTDL